MRKLFFLMTLGIFISCNKDNEYNPNLGIVGTWKLTEVLSDPVEKNNCTKVILYR